MQFSRTQVAIAAGAGLALLIVFFGGLIWLNNQGPVLSRSEEKSPLSGIPVSITLNPLRDRSSERVAGKFVRGIRDGQCGAQLADWMKDYRRKYAVFLCQSEAEHPLVSWKLVEWEDSPPLRILHYQGERRNAPNQPASHGGLFSVTLENKGGEWVVTKYDAMY